MRRTILIGTMLLALIGASVAGPQRESRACTSCYWSCRNESEALMDSCVRLGNDWNFCKDKMIENMRKCGEQRCPDCSWIQTF